MRPIISKCQDHIEKTYKEKLEIKAHEMGTNLKGSFDDILKVASDIHKLLLEEDQVKKFNIELNVRTSKY